MEHAWKACRVYALAGSNPVTSAQSLIKFHVKLNGYGIYRIIAPSGSSYVGMTTRSFEERWKDHLKDLRAQKKHKCLGLKRAYEKYGEEALVFEILEDLTGSEKPFVWHKEQVWWDALKADGVNLYNSRPTGTGSEFHTEETKLLIAQSMKARFSLSVDEISILQTLAEKLNKKNLVKITGYSLGQLSRRGIKIPPTEETFSGRAKEDNQPLSDCKICGKSIVSSRPKKTCSKYCETQFRTLKTMEGKLAIRLNNFPLNQEELKRLYLEEKLSSHRIAKLTGSTPPTVRRILRDYGIPVRSK